ncbi:hypothetical protein [Glycomyces xiaoerkulensis]|uniref:hypothetical protein n=1 Tax=Glycomyces xiaoerkulensis TaxID=2038139 RepID=UPI000C2572A1|nr:hypothetical protein [Glycomyces xiaoerkulensis]
MVQVELTGCFIEAPALTEKSAEFFASFSSYLALLSFELLNCLVSSHTRRYQFSDTLISHSVGVFICLMPTLWIAGIHG